MLSQSVILDALSHMTVIVSDCIEKPNLTAATLESYIANYCNLHYDNPPKVESDVAFKLALEYLSEHYFARMNDIRPQLQDKLYKDGYKLPWALFARTLLEEKTQRYVSMAQTSYPTQPVDSARVPYLMPQVIAIPKQIEGEVEVLTRDWAQMVAHGDVQAAIFAIDAFLVGEYDHDSDAPVPIYKGNLITVDFRGIHNARGGPEGPYNNGLYGGMQDVILVEEYVREKGMGM